ncbi:MAG: sulfite exporter TauE/SafE family protein [Candidatus Omnitrophota bacterium]|nr:sulfite exporter TauE/SafE family protein [Candidatus Omnitrophota bacterium]
MTELPAWLIAGFFLIALFYSMVGFGGGSSYLAVLVLAGLSYQTIPSLALCCNLIVTAGGCWHFYRAGHFRIRNVLPFIILSVPMAYLGGRMHVSKEVFCILLGFSLFAVAVRMFMPNRISQDPREISVKHAWAIGVPLGGALGLLAGIVGIGGGIFLSPLLLLMRWVTVKQAAAAASFFILFNSISGLAGQLQKGAVDAALLLPLGLAVFAGGQIGSRLGAYRIPVIRLQQMIGVLVLYVSVRLIMGAL